MDACTIILDHEMAYLVDMPTKCLLSVSPFLTQSHGFSIFTVCGYGETRVMGDDHRKTLS